jgi:predicted nucleotidyltransferase component of viral defense system
MITKQEIMQFAKSQGLSANTIEKDYILNWILFGINNASELKDTWIFKGGTCLKKCYFEEYRFSEDLDFTLQDESHLNGSFLLDIFKKISEWIYDESGIEIPIERLKFEEYNNPRGKLSVQGTIPYIGPMQRKSSISTIKLDLSNDEIIVNRPDQRLIYHPYSDQNTIQFKTYSIEEIFSEKLRAFVERLRPRDLYDVIHIYNDDRWQPNHTIVKRTLIDKCNYKAVPIPTMEYLEDSGKKEDLINDWQDMLAHQISNLEPYDIYWNELPKVFKWLNE